ncbi:N/A [soil metagenome]
MSFTTATSTYRQMEVYSASPAQLVVIVYDYLLLQLRRIDLAIEGEKVELRSDAVGRANAAIVELVGGLNLERGGEIGKQLSGLYTYFLAELIDIGRYSDRTRLSRLTAQVSDLREAFADIAVRPTASAA